jgi:hypothetical protein
MIENHVITHRAHPVSLPLLHLVVHHLVPIKIAAVKICRRVVVQVIVVVQLEM